MEYYNINKTYLIKPRETGKEELKKKNNKKKLMGQIEKQYQDDKRTDLNTTTSIITLNKSKPNTN